MGWHAAAERSGDEAQNRDYRLWRHDFTIDTNSLDFIEYPETGRKMEIAEVVVRMGDLVKWRMPRPAAYASCRRAGWDLDVSDTAPILNGKAGSPPATSIPRRPESR